MPDRYTEQKRAIQSQFVIGSLATYTGQRKALHGTVKIIAHEGKGGIIIDADGVRATVSPFSLLPVATVRPPGRGKRPEVPQNGHTPTARIFRNGVPVVQDQKKKPVTGSTDESDALARLRQIGQPSAPPPPVTPPAPPAAPPPLTPPLGKGNVEAFFFRWLRDFRRSTPHAMRQGVIDHFTTLPVYLRARVPVEPGLHQYRQAIYYITAATLADPTRLPPAADIQVLLAARFRVTSEAVAVHLKWMRKRLEADHAAFVAQHATVGVTQ